MIRRVLLPAALLAGALLLPAASASAGTVELFNDEVIHGEILSVDAQFVVVRIPTGGTVRYAMREVRDVRTDSGLSILPRSGAGSSVRHGPRGATGGLGGTGTAGGSGLLGGSGILGGSGAPGGTASSAPTGATGIAGPTTQSGPSSARPPVMGLDGAFDDGRLSVRLPASFRATRLDADLVAFSDERGALPWTFNVTSFSGRDEADFDAIRSRAQSELERISGYRAVRREPVAVGGGLAERTTGVYERDGRTIRHDQLVVRAAGGVLVIHFFSPGATLDEGAVPEVEAVIRSIKLK